MLTIPAGGWHQAAAAFPLPPSWHPGALLPGQMLALGRTLQVSCVLYLYPITVSAES